jgi:hypothetical protein
MQLTCMFFVDMFGHPVLSFRCIPTSTLWTLFSVLMVLSLVPQHIIAPPKVGLTVVGRVVALHGSIHRGLIDMCYDIKTARECYYSSKTGS